MKRGFLKSKGQASMEMMVLIGFVLLLSTPLVIIYYKYSYETEFDLSQNQAFNIANKLVDKAESVYYQGPPSKETLKVAIPKNIESISINERDITFVMEYKANLVDIVAVSRVNLSGTLTNSPGIKYITIVSNGTHALING